MTIKRKFLTAISLLLFLLGSFIALNGELAGAFIYWFILAVIFTGLWFLVGPSTSASAANGGGIADPASQRQTSGYGHMKVVVCGPDSVTREYTPEELRQHFIAGAVTVDWIAREKDESDWRPVAEVLYAPLFLTTPRGNWLDRGAIRYSPWMYWAHLLICQIPGFILGLVYVLGCSTPEGKMVGWKLVIFCSVGVLIAIILRVIFPGP